MTEEVIQNEETKEPFAGVQTKVAREAIRDEMTLTELSQKNGVHPTQIGTWKRAAIENMAIAFTRKDSTPGAGQCHRHRQAAFQDWPIGGELDFLAEATHQLLGARRNSW